ncbi:MAG: hypothetical protein SOX83_07550, partial [Sodaliphilus sp.]|nr:hypothetical protein [Sodaliphilus sp.]
FPPACVATHDPILQAIAVVFFAEAALFSLHAQKRAVISVLNERAVYLFKKKCCKSIWYVKDYF